jgi:hypothetical protein
MLQQFDPGFGLIHGQPLITSVLEQFTTERMAIIRYHDRVSRCPGLGRQATGTRRAVTGRGISAVA